MGVISDIVQTGQSLLSGESGSGVDDLIGTVEQGVDVGSLFHEEPDGSRSRRRNGSRRRSGRRIPPAEMRKFQRWAEQFPRAARDFKRTLSQVS